MDAHERQLITDLFDRIRDQGPVEKDAGAAALISQSVRQMPDAPYMLVQSVIVQDMALQQADERIRELEARIESLQQQEQTRPAAGGGSFLGGLFGSGGRATDARVSSRTGSVPAAGQPRPAAASSTPWGSTPPQAPARTGGGGGFLQSAMATAAGVAGGMLLADGIRSMMGGSAPSSGSQTAASDAASHALPSDYQDPSQNDPGYSDEGVQDASYDDGGGDFDGGMDI